MERLVKTLSVGQIVDFLSKLAQILLAIMAVVVFFYTVRPFHQYELLKEKTAIVTQQLKKSEKELESVVGEKLSALQKRNALENELTVLREERLHILDETAKLKQALADSRSELEKLADEKERSHWRIYVDTISTTVMWLEMYAMDAYEIDVDSGQIIEKNREYTLRETLPYEMLVEVINSRETDMNGNSFPFSDEKLNLYRGKLKALANEDKEELRSEFHSEKLKEEFSREAEQVDETSYKSRNDQLLAKYNLLTKYTDLLGERRSRAFALVENFFNNHVRTWHTE